MAVHFILVRKQGAGTLESEEYRFVYEDVTDNEDYALITDGIDFSIDYGTLL